MTGNPVLATAGSAKGGSFQALASAGPRVKVIVWLPLVAVGVALTTSDHSLSPELLVAQTLNS